MVARFPRSASWFSVLCLATLLVNGCATTAAPQAANAAPIHYALTYVAVGASDAYGVGTDAPAYQSWPSVLAGQLSANTHLVNLGIPGATVAEAQRTEVPIAVTTHPNVITVWLALNDYAAQVPLATYRAQLSALLTTLAATGARVFVGNMPDLTLLPYFAERAQTQLHADVSTWNDAIESVIAATGTHLVDIHADFAELATHPEYLSNDGLHPSTEGAQRLAAYFATAIHP
ncbi:MAG: hypothetical protein H0X24_08585 [Ktedonobacterales bacterium]|nr:hypothetical protein [Ktedonobacterales bacterium]